MNWQFRYRIRRSGKSRWAAWSIWLAYDGKTMQLPTGVSLNKGDDMQVEVSTTVVP